MAISTNMLLPIPTVGVTIGPEWATNVNACLSIIDTHNHSPGSGVQITPDGLDINAQLPMNNNTLALARTVQFQAQGAVLTDPADLRSVYAVGSELYYNDGAGNQVQITNNGSVAGAAGNITNLSSPAAVVYSNISKTFTFLSDVTTPANLDAGSVVFRNILPGSYGLTLQPPAAMSADYVLTLPSLPASKKIVTLNASGSIVADYDVDNATIEVSSNNLRVKAGGITDTQLSTNSVTTAKIVDLAVTTAKLDNLAVTAAKIDSNAVYTNAVQDLAITPRKTSGTVSAQSAPIAAGPFGDNATFAQIIGFTTSANANKVIMITWSKQGGGSAIVPAGGTNYLELFINGNSQGVINLNDGSGATFTSADHTWYVNTSSITGAQVLNMDLVYRTNGPGGLTLTGTASRLRAIEI